MIGVVNKATGTEIPWKMLGCWDHLYLTTIKIVYSEAAERTIRPLKRESLESTLN